MNEADLFWVSDNKGHKEQMEAVTIYSMDVTGFNYIIYRNIWNYYS